MSMAQIGPARLMSWRGYAYACAVVVLWAGFSLAGRHAALGGGVRLTPWDLGALRFGVSLPVALVAAWLGFGRGISLRRSFVTAVVAGLCFPLPSYLGFTFAPAAHGAVILSGMLPFLVAIGLRFVSPEPWSQVRKVSFAVLLLGVLLLGIEASVKGARPGAWRGDLLFLVGASAWAAYTILAKRWAMTPGQAVVSIGLWCGVIYLPIWFLFLPSTLSWAPVAEIASQAVIQGFLVTTVSLILFIRALTLLGPTRLTMITAMVPVLAGLLAVPLLGETAGVLDWAGLALVSLAIAVGVPADARRAEVREDGGRASMQN